MGLEIPLQRWVKTRWARNKKQRSRITIGEKKQSTSLGKLIHENPELFEFINRQSSLNPQQYIEKLSKNPPLSCSDTFVNVNPVLDGNRRNAIKVVEKYIANLLKYIGNKFQI